MQNWQQTILQAVLGSRSFIAKQTLRTLCYSHEDPIIGKEHAQTITYGPAFVRFYYPPEQNQSQCLGDYYCPKSLHYSEIRIQEVRRLLTWGQPTD